jgi:hypothetical protein
MVTGSLWARRFHYLAAFAVLIADASLASWQAKAHSSAIGVNLARGSSDGTVGANPSDQYESVGAGFWNNVVYGGSSNALLDCNGMATTAGIQAGSGGADLQAVGSYGGLDLAERSAR